MPAITRGSLDRDRRVMDEVDQDAQVGHHQPERHGDPDVRDEVPVRARPDGTSTSTAYTKVATNVLECQLGPAITDEVPQHPRPELGRRQGQGDQDDREDHADNRDDRGPEHLQAGHQPQVGPPCHALFHMGRMHVSAPGQASASA